MRIAIALLVSLISMQAQIPQPTDVDGWKKRVISADRTNKQACLSLGVIAWTEFFPAWSEARAADGLKPQDAGPIRTAASRTKLLSQFGPLVEDGIANLREAIKIDPQY